MIIELLEQAGRRAEAADAALKTDETLTLSFEAGRLKSAAVAEERGINLRVLAGGRVGFAGTTTDDLDAVLDAAFASARVGEAIPLRLPGPAQLPRVLTHYPRAAAASAADLAQLGRMLQERLGADNRQVSIVLERSVGSVRAANTLGADAEYDVSTVSIGVEVTRVVGDDVTIVDDHIAGADLPGMPELESLVTRTTRRLEWARQAAAAPAGPCPVCFTPPGTAVLLAPFRLACRGKSVLQGISPLADQQGARRFDAAFTLRDEPLLDGHSGSRPVDDEGTPCRPLAVVEHGVVGEFIYDLETAAQGGVPPTGHGRRTTFGKPQASWSNLVVSPGSASLDELLALMPDGLLVDALLGVGQGNVIGGAFSHPVALAYRVRNGEVVGRVHRATVAGSVYELLRRVTGVGKDLQWMGSVAAPAMVIEGVAVSGG